MRDAEHDPVVCRCPTCGRPTAASGRRERHMTVIWCICCERPFAMTDSQIFAEAPGARHADGAWRVHSRELQWNL
jgi:hypothetical protein